MKKLLQNILYNFDKTQATCFLCFKTSGICSSIYETFKIWDDKFEYTVSLLSIVKCLFPTFDIIMRQCCEDCSSCLTKIFMKFQFNQRIQTLMYSALKSISSEINNIDLENIQDSKIVIKLSNDVDACEEAKNNTNIMDTIYKCKACPMKFDSKEEYEYHCIALHTNKNISTIYKQCPYCLKLLKDTSNFKIHVKKHHNVRKKLTKKTVYRCHDCIYSSFNKKSLEAHMYKVHLNIRPYMCALCEKGFYKKSNLTEHMRFVHSKNCSVICEHCGENFSSSKTLARHLRIHTNEKPFECNVCGLKFITSGRRTEHMKRKHLPKTEICLICDKQFSLKKDLNTHVKKYHS